MIKDKINEALRHFREGNPTQEDREIIYKFLGNLYKRHKDSLYTIDRGPEDAEDIIQEFITEKLWPKVTLFTDIRYLGKSFENYLVDIGRAERNPEARLFKKIETQLKELGYERISRYLYIKQGVNPNDTPASLKELKDLDLPEVPYKGYKEESKKEDEIIDKNDLIKLITQIFNSINKPIDIRYLKEKIQAQIMGPTKGPKHISLQEPIGKKSEDEEEDNEKTREDTIGGRSDDIIDWEMENFIKKEVLPKLSKEEQKILYNYFVEELTPEEEAEKEGVSHQTVRNCRKEIDKKLANILKNKEFSEEDMQVFLKNLINIFEKQIDYS